MHLRTAYGRLGEASQFLNWLPPRSSSTCSTTASWSADRPDPGLRPWGGATATAIAEMPSGRAMNKTPPLSDDILRPMLAAALYLASAVGPHATILNQQVREADQQWAPQRPRRVRQAVPRSCRRDHPAREPIEAAVSEVGVQEMFARDGALMARRRRPAPGPVDRAAAPLEAVALVGVVRTASTTVIAAVSGMRACELMELQVACRSAEEPLPGMARYRLASKLIKGQPLGGTRDEWVVIEPAYQAAGLAEQLRDAPADGDLLFGRIAFSIRYKSFRKPVNAPPASASAAPFAFITAALDAGVPLRDVQEAASHADPRTTMRYDRARGSLDRHATYIVTAYLAGAAR